MRGRMELRTQVHVQGSGELLDRIWCLYSPLSCGFL